MAYNNERTLQRAQLNRDYSEHPDYWDDDYEWMELKDLDEEEAEDEVNLED